MSEGKNDKWKMPKPVFRSTTGGLPKSFEETISQQFTHDDIRNAAPDEDDDILSIMELPTDPANRPDPVSSEQVLDVHPEPADAEDAADAQADAIAETQPKRATFWSFTTIFLLIVVIAAAVVIGILYFVRSGSGDAY